MPSLMAMATAISVLAPSFLPAVRGIGCEMCPDGGIVKFPDRKIPDLVVDGNPDPTCRDAYDYALNEFDAGVCDFFQSQAAYCGCQAVDDTSDILPVDACSLCPRAADVPANGGQMTYYGIDCSTINEYVRHQPASQCPSRRIQRMMRLEFNCGCPDAPAPTCVMCDDGTNDMQHPERVVPFFNLGSDPNPTCMDLADRAAIDLVTSCGPMEDQAVFCGCPGTTPVNACSFCPNGDAPTLPDLVTPSDDSCAMLDEYVASRNDAFCETGVYDSIEALAFTCGCPNAEPKCTLCPDGSEPGLPDKTIDSGSTTCAEQAFRVQSLDETRCGLERTINELYAFQCDCPQAQAPQCIVTNNEDLCTPELFDDLPDGTEDCECFSFCQNNDGTTEFTRCFDFPGSIDSTCNGVSIDGCNPRLAGIEPTAEGSGVDSWSLHQSSSRHVWMEVVGMLLTILASL